MSEISANILPNKNTVERKSGFISHTDAVNLVRDLQRESEYKQQVTARVTKVYTSQFDLPILTRNDGVDTPAWNMFGKIDVELNHNGKVINNIGLLFEFDYLTYRNLLKISEHDFSILNLT